MIDHHLSWGGSDPFNIPQVEERYYWYGYSGIVPVAIFDGVRDVVGSQNSCDGAYARYGLEYDGRMADTGGQSPISIDGCWGEGSFQATFRLEDGVLPDPVQGTFFLYEDSLLDHGTYYNEVTRVIVSAPVTGLEMPGDEVQVILPYASNPAWNLAHLHAVALLERSGWEQEVYQAARLRECLPVAVAGGVSGERGILRAFPNPFSNHVMIRACEWTQAQSHFEIFDVCGRLVRSFRDFGGPYGAEVTWDGRDETGGRLMAGTYFGHPAGDKPGNTIRLILIR